MHDTSLTAAIEPLPVQASPEHHTQVGWQGLSLSSAFQPIYSISHGRLVGHEALLRAHDALGRAVPPIQVFAQCADAKSLSHCDRLTHAMHLSNYAQAKRHDEWLFLNVQPVVFERLARSSHGAAFIRQICTRFGLLPESIVLEVLETEAMHAGHFVRAMEIVRESGMLLAIDDFGSGHSNFDRVWRLQPDIVKLDRSLVARAALSRQVHRVMSQMISLLHECGAMVLMEGVETADEAMLALDCDADLVQGYYFGRPQATMMPPRHAPATLDGLHDILLLKRQSQRKAHRTLIAPFLNAIGHAGVLLSVGRPAEEARRSFLELPDAELCYVLDAQGYQVGGNIWHDNHPDGTADKRSSPMRDGQGACWARRPYFRRAIEALDKVQITRPYRTLNGHHQCVTASMAYRCEVNGRPEIRVVCGDVRWLEGNLT